MRGYKVGDEIRFIKEVSNYKKGDIATITKIDIKNNEMKFDNGKTYYIKDYFDNTSIFSSVRLYETIEEIKEDIKLGIRKVGR